jgi:WD40 repeat protein
VPEGLYFSAAVGGKQQQLLAVAMNDGVGFWNLDTGAELHFLSRPGAVDQVVFEPSGTLLTLEHNSGVYRWEIPEDFAGPAGPGLGPPQRLPFPRGGSAISQSRDGRVLAMGVRNLLGFEPSVGTWVLHAGEPERPVRLDAQDAGYVGVSPDGLWVATGTHQGDTLRIWEAHSGRLVRTLKQGGGVAVCQFSPDGKRLATGLDGSRVWAVDEEPWKEGLRLRPGDVVNHPVFSPDSKIIAFDTNAGAVRLVDAATGDEILELPDPHLDLARPLFTPDGKRLITLTNGTVRGIHVWDLRSIHRQLAALGLEWK